MRYVFVDRITELRPFEAARGVKSVSCQEPYLADHFEGFPVLPGVLMVQGGLELAEWLCRASKGFPRSDFRPVRISRVRYLRMVRPGDRLETEVTVSSWDGDVADFKVRGVVGTDKVFTARLALAEVPCPPSGVAGSTEWERAVEERQKATFAALMGLAPASDRAAPASHRES